MSVAARRKLFAYGIVVPFAVVLSFPFVWMAITSLKFQGDVYNTAAAGYGLQVGLMWWIPGMLLAGAYAFFLYRRFAGKVVV